MTEETRIEIQEDPTDLSDARRKLKKVMIALGNAKKELKDLENGTPLIKETYHVELENNVSQPLTDIILSLGEISGFLLADDIIENRIEQTV